MSTFLPLFMIYGLVTVYLVAHTEDIQRNYFARHREEMSADAIFVTAILWPVVLVVTVIGVAWRRNKL